jgi:hypothetical protein
MSKLSFRSNNDLKSLAKETLKHKKFKLPYQNKTISQKSLFLVKDEGIYLMNSYCNDKGKRKTVKHVVYAVGFNPKTNENCWEDCRYAVGGDDFAESIPFNIDQLKRVADGGNISIEVTETTLQVEA